MRDSALRALGRKALRDPADTETARRLLAEQRRAGLDAGLNIDRYQLEASICRESLYDFVQRFWSIVEQAKPVWNWHIKVICDELQEAAERVLRGEPKKYDLVINVPPGTTKSLVCSVMFPAWLWTRMPSCQVISTSHAHSLAMSMSRRSRMIVESEKWTQLFGPIGLAGDQNAKAHFENSKGGWRFAAGTDGNVIGRHAHVIIIDDPINPQEAVSIPILASANRFITETLATRKTDKEVSLTILIMQRLHQNDPSAIMLNESRSGGTPIRHICLPGVVELGKNPRKYVRPRRLAHYYVNGLLDPVRLSHRTLVILRKRLGEYGFAGQILQSPVPLGGGMFKVDRLTLDVPPDYRSFKKLIRFWDKAATAGAGAWTAGVLMGEDKDGKYWILDVIRGQWDSARREAIIKQTAQLDTNLIIVGVEQEPGSGGKESALSTVKNLAGFRVRIERPTGDKIIRADPFSVQVNGRNVCMRRADWNKEFIEELQFFPFSTYKDQVDASSGAFTLLTRAKIKVGALW